MLSFFHSLATWLWEIYLSFLSQFFCQVRVVNTSQGTVWKLNKTSCVNRLGSGLSLGWHLPQSDNPLHWVYPPDVHQWDAAKHLFSRSWCLFHFWELVMLGYSKPIDSLWVGRMQNPGPTINSKGSNSKPRMTSNGACIFSHAIFTPVLRNNRCVFIFWASLVAQQ